MREQICLFTSSLSSDSSIHGMEARVSKPSNRCFPTKLGQKGTPLCISPFSLIWKVLLKVKTERVLMILVTPNWPVQPWYSQILELWVEQLLLLTRPNKLLKNLLGQIHTLIVKHTKRLVAWKVSGNSRLLKAFQKEFQTYHKCKATRHYF